MKKICLILLVIFSANIFAQNLPGGVKSVKPDSLKTKIETPKITLRLNSEVRNSKYFLGYKPLENKYYLNFYPAAEAHSEEKENPYSKDSMKKLQAAFSNQFKFFRDANTRKYDTGIFGKILGYASTAAVFGLGAYHIYKYDIKKEK